MLKKKKTIETTKKQALLEKYTDGKVQPILDPRLRLGQTEAYIEYNADGRMKTSNLENVIIRTKYEEDIYLNNHTSVWGSYYSRRESCWGYACCHSCLKSSYCVGKKGIEIEESQQPFTRKATTNTNTNTNSTTNAANVTNPFSTKALQRTSASELFGELSNPTSMNLNEKQLQKLKDTLQNTNTNKQQNVDNKDAKQEHGDETGTGGAEDGNSNGKRGYHSMHSVEMSQEEMEMYRLKRVKADDPMANYVDEDDLPPQ